jgi:hypothetical protein
LFAEPTSCQTDEGACIPMSRIIIRCDGQDDCSDAAVCCFTENTDTADEDDGETACLDSCDTDSQHIVCEGDPAACIAAPCTPSPGVALCK